MAHPALLRLRSSALVLSVLALGIAVPMSLSAQAAPAQENGPERTYCAWQSPAISNAAATLQSLGYERVGGTENGGAFSFITGPRHGVSLRVELVNLVGRTRVRVVSSNATGANAVNEFFASFEQTLTRSACPPAP